MQHHDPSYPRSQTQAINAQGGNSDLSRDTTTTSTDRALTASRLRLVADETPPRLRIDDPNLEDAVTELELLISHTRVAILSHERFRALSSLVAIQPLVGHLIEGCNERISEGSAEPSGCTDKPGGYL